MIPHVVPAYAGLHVMLHGLCGALLPGWLAHAWRMSQSREGFRSRMGGLGATSGGLAVTSVLLLAP